MPHTADRRLYLNRDRTKVVEDGDPDAAVLFATPGTEISDEDAEKYGLGKKAEKPADTKAVPRPPSDKGR